MERSTMGRCWRYSASLAGLSGGLAGLALQRVVWADLEALAVAAAGAANAQRAVGAGGGELRPTRRADGAGYPVRAGRGAGGVVDGEVIDGEPTARHRFPTRCGLDPVGVATAAQLVAELSGAVGRIGQHGHRLILALEQVEPDDGLVAVAAAGLAQRAVGDDPGVRLDRDMGFEPVLTARDGLVRVPGLRVDSGDHPVRGDPFGDAPPPVGALGVLDWLHVLPGHQREQRDRLSGLRAELLLGQVAEQPVRITDQRV